MRACTSTEDLIDVLKAQHGRIRDLFDQVPRSEGADRREAFQALVRLLTLHEGVEAEIVHPAARRFPGGDGSADDRLAEERGIRELLSELDGMDTGAPGFLKALDRLRMDVLTHMRAEERYEFGRLLRNRVG